MSARTVRSLAALAFAAIALLSFQRPAQAVPSFASQTGQACTACHIGAFGPQLTAYGRAFKIGGYTLEGGEGLAAKVPLAAFVQTSFTHTKAAQPGGAAPGWAGNDNASVDAVSVFVAGRINDYAGALIQGTYAGIGKTTFLDNSDIRVTTPIDIGDTNLRIGLSVNNGPTVQDPFNSSMVWGPPYQGSALAPSPAYEPFLMGSFLGQVLGVTAYAWYDNAAYAEFGFYRTLSDKLAKTLGTYGNPYNPGSMASFSPYGRLAYEWNWGGQTAHIGAIGMQTTVHPLEMAGVGTDKYTDVAIDGSYQWIGDGTHIISVLSSLTHEVQHLDATSVTSGSNRSNTLDEFRAILTYFYQNTYGGSVGIKRIWGSADPVMFANGGNNKPDSTGLILEADYVPFGNDGSFGAPFANVKLGLQYTAYPQFNGVNAGASANNTIYAFAWFAF